MNTCFNSWGKWIEKFRQIFFFSKQLGSQIGRLNCFLIVFEGFSSKDNNSVVPRNQVPLNLCTFLLRNLNLTNEFVKTETVLLPSSVVWFLSNCPQIDVFFLLRLNCYIPNLELCSRGKKARRLSSRHLPIHWLPHTTYGGEKRFHF